MTDKKFDAVAFEQELEHKFQHGASPYTVYDDGDIPDYRTEWYWLEEYFWDGLEQAKIALRIFIKYGFKASAMDNCLKILRHIDETDEWWPVFLMFANTVEDPNEKESLAWSRMIHGEEANTMIEQCKKLGRFRQAAYLENLAKEKAKAQKKPKFQKKRATRASPKKGKLKTQ